MQKVVGSNPISRSFRKPRYGEGPPLHVHNREDESVYVLEGEFRWRLGDHLSTAGPGSFVFIPRGLPHTWQVVGDEPGRMLITFVPAWMEGFFDRLSSLTEFDLEAFRAAATEHGMDVVGPPLAESHACSRPSPAALSAPR